MILRQKTRHLGPQETKAHSSTFPYFKGLRGRRGLQDVVELQETEINTRKIRNRFYRDPQERLRPKKILERLSDRVPTLKSGQEWKRTVFTGIPIFVPIRVRRTPDSIGVGSKSERRDNDLTH